MTEAPPAAPQASGTVVRQTQTVTWTEPASSTPITRYQLQTRNSANHSWRFTTAGSPSPSRNIGATARSRSVTTPAGLARHYRVRASTAGGDGAWSNVVKLKSNQGLFTLTGGSTNGSRRCFRGSGGT